MSNISVDLKVIEVTAPMVARALGEPVALTLGGLNLLWHRCWSLKTDTITATGLAGIFGPEKLSERIDQLVDAGFLEASSGSYRVRGAERYLRLREGNSKGGHASKSNLIPGGKRSKEPRGGAEGEPRGEPSESRADVSAPPSALFGSSPNTEHRTPNTSRRSARTERAPDPRHAPLVKQLVEAFQADREAPYPFGPRDAKAVSNLLARAEPDAIVAAWERALRHQGFPTVSTLPQLEQHLAVFVAPPRATQGRGPVPAEATDWTKQPTGEMPF